jgi:hypothetical protein
MMRIPKTARALLPACAILIGAAPALAQTTDSITLYEFPAFFGRSVTITSATPDLAAQSFAKTARSARVTGSWTACRAATYAGTCTLLTSDQPTLFLVGLDKAIVSLRPTNAAATAAPTTGTAASGTTTPATGVPATASTPEKVNIEALDVDAGSRGQDTAYFPRPSLSKTQLSAGTSDKAAGDAFCKIAGYSTSVYAARGLTQQSGLIDAATSTKVRGFPLRDVLCHR